MDESEKARGVEKDAELARDDDSSSLSSVGDQAGTKGVEAITQAWTLSSLVAAYVGVLLIATAVSLEQQINLGLIPYVTSDFRQHSLVALVYVVQGAVNASIKPVMAKIANVFGRLEAFTISVFLLVLAYIQMAASKNVAAYTSAQIFYSAGFTGILIITQIFIADTSDLRWRALFSSLPDTPFLWTVWVGPLITPRFVGQEEEWRWGYGYWAIVIPVVFLPLAVALFVNLRKAKRLGINPARPWAGVPLKSYLVDLWFQMDVMGLLLFAAAVSLITLPLTLANNADGRWSNPSMIAMEVIGCICLVAFPFWEASPRLAPYPFMPLRLLKNRTVVLGFITGFFYFVVFYTSVFPYFNSYLQVVQGQSVTAAGHITQIFSFASTVTSVVVGVLIKLTHHYKGFIILGAAVYLLGIGLMIRYRDEGVSIATNVGIQIAVGIGGGMFNVPTQLAVQAAVDHGDVATVTALFLTFIEVGSAVGSAASANIWTDVIPARLSQNLPPESIDQAALIFGNLTLAASFPEGSPTRIVINQSYQDAMRRILIVSVCFAAPVFLLAFGIRGVNVGKVDQKVRGKVIGNASSSDDVDGVDNPVAHEGRFSRLAFWKRSSN